MLHIDCAYEFEAARVCQRANASGAWEWHRLPSFPYPVAMHAVASIGTKVYVQGGACYNRKSFVNFNDCNGGTPGLGKRLYEFDVQDDQGEWKRLPVSHNVAHLCRFEWLNTAYAS